MLYEEKVKKLMGEGYEIAKTVYVFAIQGIPTVEKLAINGQAKVAYPMRIATPSTEAHFQALLAEKGFKHILVEYQHGLDLTCNAAAKSPLSEKDKVERAGTWAKAAGLRDLCFDCAGNAELWKSVYTAYRSLIEQWYADGVPVISPDHKDDNSNRETYVPEVQG